MSLKIIIDSSEYTKGLKRFKATLYPKAARNTLNEMALKGSSAQRNELRRKFHVRNRWSEGSIFPKAGKRLGLIPPYQNNLNTMAAQTGTLQQYLADQEAGFSRKKPSIPAYKRGRAGGTLAGKVRAPAKMKKIKSLGAKRTRDYDLRGRDRSSRTKQLVAMLSKNNYRGFLRLYESDGWTPGYYRLTKRRVDLVRSRRFEGKRYSARVWHKPAVSRIAQQGVMARVWERHAAAALTRL